MDYDNRKIKLIMDYFNNVYYNIHRTYGKSL